MRRTLWPLFGLVALLIGAGARAEPMTIDEVVAAARAGVEFVDNAYLKERAAANPDLVLLDVRSESEFAAGHIPEARSVPRGVAEFEVARSIRDADAEIIVYCRTGSRAALVKKALLGQGYRNVRAHDGYETWEAEESVEIPPAEDD